MIHPVKTPDSYIEHHTLRARSRMVMPAIHVGEAAAPNRPPEDRPAIVPVMPVVNAQVPSPCEIVREDDRDELGDHWPRWQRHALTTG
jgi:hypothetical protein